MPKQDNHYGYTQQKAEYLNERYKTNLSVGKTYNYFNLYSNNQRETIATGTAKEIYKCLYSLEKGLELAFGNHARKPLDFPPLLEKQIIHEHSLQDEARKGLHCSCGSQDFTVSEVLTWKASTEDTTVKMEVVCHNTGNAIEAICCDQCGRVYEEKDFDEFNATFNFQ